MDSKETEKDNEKAIIDLEEYCQRNDLPLQLNDDGRWIKSKAKFTLNDGQNKDVCEWVDQLKMPDGYAFNLGRCVDMEHFKLFRMKSHDCHIFMQYLMPVAFRALPKPIWKSLTKLSLFFKDLCSTVLRVDHLMQMEQNIPVILSKSTYNSGVCVSGIGQDDITSEYYGFLKEIIEFEWPMTLFIKLVLFYCDWFDPSKHGMKVDSQFGISKVQKRGKYSKFYPFIFPQTTTQVYYANHLERKGNKVDWWVVIKTKPREAVNTRYNLEVAYQEEQSRFSASIENDPIDCLRDEQVDSEEVDESSFKDIVNENERDIIEEKDDYMSNKEEEGDEKTTSEEANDEEEETSEEVDFSGSEDSTSHFHTQEKDED
ncbi:hypothetical protein CQW23_16767 [Capsicum baccatum]|uniref:DUF4216 domain-containing protein n=1 Tax=Capsicum baccatum TaxID=33114 RepID=A0A2G2WC14_CAPBA|nr:hypothetical protein CQW23_16767 [Capsicum baccatum]